MSSVKRERSDIQRKERETFSRRKTLSSSFFFPCCRSFFSLLFLLCSLLYALSFFSLSHAQDQHQLSAVRLAVAAAAKEEERNNESLSLSFHRHLQAKLVAAQTGATRIKHQTPARPLAHGLLRSFPAHRRPAAQRHLPKQNGQRSISAAAFRREHDGQPAASLTRVQKAELLQRILRQATNDLTEHYHKGSLPDSVALTEKIDRLAEVRAFLRKEVGPLWELDYARRYRLEHGGRVVETKKRYENFLNGPEKMALDRDLKFINRISFLDGRIRALDSVARVLPETLHEMDSALLSILKQVKKEESSGVLSVDSLWKIHVIDEELKTLPTVIKGDLSLDAPPSRGEAARQKPFIDETLDAPWLRKAGSVLEHEGKDYQMGRELGPMVNYIHALEAQLRSDIRVVVAKAETLKHTPPAELKAVKLEEWTGPLNREGEAKEAPGSQQIQRLMDAFWLLREALKQPVVKAARRDS